MSSSKLTRGASDVFHHTFQEVWGTIQREWCNRWLDYESDVQASVYHHIRRVYEPPDFRIWFELKWKRADGTIRRPDIAVGLGPSESSPWVALEFKGLYGGNVQRFEWGDLEKLREDFEDPGR